MQTFLPVKSYSFIAKILDWRRLGKQRVEAYQILNILLDRTTKTGWKNHPAVKMWKGYEISLSLYMNEMIREWKIRGYNNNMLYEDIGKSCKSDIIHPPWLGDERLHSSHRANLLRKDYKYYSKFGWSEEPVEGYFWP
jgi:hypothetical protein